MSKDNFSFIDEILEQTAINLKTSPDEIFDKGVIANAKNVLVSGFKAAMLEAENKKYKEGFIDGEIKALAHILVRGATGRKHIGLNRTYVVGYLAEKQQERKDSWEALETLVNSKEED